MKKIIILLVMALLMAGAADAQSAKGKTKKRKATTTATTKSKSKTKAKSKTKSQTSVRSTPTPILPPQREITDEMWRNEGNDLYRDLLEEGRDDAEILFQVGLLWHLGSFGEKDDEEALRWYYLAAQHDIEDKWSLGQACYEVGDAYMMGRYGVKENKLEAAKWFAKGQQCGNGSASFALGLMLDSKDITREQLNRVVEQLGLNGNEVANQGKNEYDDFHRLEPYRGTWTCASGSVITIDGGPRITIHGGGTFDAEWTSDGQLLLDFGSRRLTLKYSDGYLYDGNGRMWWRVP